VPRLIEAIQRNDAKTISQLADEHGVQLFNIGDARDILGRLSESQHRFALERCPVQDRPKLKVTKMIPDPTKPRYVSGEFAQLSLGQQQSVLLALLLSSDSSAP
jgi:hypothetical protein